VEDDTKRSDEPPAGLRFSVRWGALALASMAALAWLAPSGLVLLVFLGIVIATHEAGHLLVARRVGMIPTEYFWGFGPEVCSIERDGCRYGVKVLFLGGYVKLHGMTPSSTLPSGFPEHGTYRSASHRGRLATILAGPLVNLATAVAVFAAAALLEGASLPAALRSAGADLWFVVAGTAEALWIWASGIGPYVASLSDTSGATEAPVRFLSPVAQAQVSGWAVDNGTATSLRWLGILSCAVGVVNLLPLPPLDGSHALVAGLEAVLNRARPGRTVRLDAARLVPLAYLTVGVLVFLSASALVLDLRDIT